MAAKPNNVISISCNLDSFFRYWFMFLEPFHHLTSREMDVITCFLKKRYQLSKVIKDEDILDTVTMSEKTRQEVREECNMTLPHFQVILGKLRKSKVIIDNKINPKFIPNVTEDEGPFKLLLYFDIKK